jgi:hypothetical protein
MNHELLAGKGRSRSNAALCQSSQADSSPTPGEETTP